MMLELKGIEQLLSNIRTLKEDLKNEIKKEMSQMGADSLAVLKSRTALPTGSAEPGAFKPSEGGVKGSVWEGQVQKAPRGAHNLHDRLTHVTSSEGNRKIRTEYGYREGDETKVMYWVLYGTKKLVARPFLQVRQDEDKDRFKSIVEKAARRVINGRSNAK